MDLNLASQHLRLLADSTRLRLLLLLEQEELSVAELAAILQLAQPRVSTHLAKLKDAQLVIDRREGVSVYYRRASDNKQHELAALWQWLSKKTDDPLVQQDRERIPQVLASRNGDSSWADTVAGDMERHYSPGRTWEATTRALTALMELGDVLDIASGDGVLAELLAPHAAHITCLDISPRVVEAGRKRLANFNNVTFEVGDMHALPLTDASQDTVFLMHALTYTNQPQQVITEAARVLRPGGSLLAMTLAEHKHQKAVAPYDHSNLGFRPADLQALCKEAGLRPTQCKVAAVEKRAPHFTVLSLIAHKPGTKP